MKGQFSLSINDDEQITRFLRSFQTFIEEPSDQSFVDFMNISKFDYNVVKFLSKRFAEPQLVLESLGNEGRNCTKIYTPRELLESDPPFSDLDLSDEKFFLVAGLRCSGKTSICLQYIDWRRAMRPDLQVFVLQTTSVLEYDTLIGSFVQDEFAGSYHWQFGFLSKILLDEGILVMEDFDNASFQTLSIFRALIERNELHIGELGLTLQMNPKSKIFFTYKRSIDEAKNNISIDQVFAKLNSIHCKLEDSIEDYCLALLSAEAKNTVKNIIQVTKDVRFQESNIFTLCHRLVSLQSKDVSIKFLIDSIYSIFCLSQKSFEESKQLLYRICSHLGLGQDIVDVKLFNSSPNLSRNSNILNIDGYELECDSLSQYRMNENFSMNPFTLSLLKQVVLSVKHQENILIVGESGIGKTSIIKLLAEKMGKKLVCINLGEDSDINSLFGYHTSITSEIKHRNILGKFLELFTLEYDLSKNEKLTSSMKHMLNSKQFVLLRKLLINLCEMQIKKNSDTSLPQYKQWAFLLSSLNTMSEDSDRQINFQYCDGILTDAIRNGDWVLLDEVNHIPKECFSQFISLVDRVNKTFYTISSAGSNPEAKNGAISKHNDLQIFACMNPETDYGKKSLPAEFLSRFTEIRLDAMPPIGIMDYESIVSFYVPEQFVNSVVKSFDTLKQNRLSLRTCDGVPPKFTIRTLCRALKYFKSLKQSPISLYECLTLFLTSGLDNKSIDFVNSTLKSNGLSNPLSKNLRFSDELHHNVTFIEGIPVKNGDHIVEKTTTEDYIITHSIREKLRILAKICSSSTPALLQGETSAGKTSIVSYLARKTNNKCVRLNNHEGTDINDYIGNFVISSEGKFYFKDGLIVEAMKKGYWVILDELNLAPPEALELLNSLLDDNKQIFVPESKETVIAHKNFRIFATQNPVVGYQGRKRLTDAFLNRFVSINFDSASYIDMAEILCKRFQVPMSLANKMVGTMESLQDIRSASSAFRGNKSLITFRDLIRWSRRYSFSEDKLKAHAQRNDMIDWNLFMAEHGFIILSSRTRNIDDANRIKLAIESKFNQTIDVSRLYTINPEICSLSVRSFASEIHKFKETGAMDELVLNQTTERLLMLISIAFYFNEPILLIGPTGCGKTMISYKISEMLAYHLESFNFNACTDSSDFIGSMVPVSNPGSLKFEWRDGILIKSMKKGNVLLLDEISLAENAVLERINSILEEERMIVLAENFDLNSTNSTIHAHPDFKIIATMNPSGDFGKKELTWAMRSRFFEIFVENSVTEQSCIDNVVKYMGNLNNFSGFSYKYRLLGQIFYKICTNLSKVNLSYRDISLFCKCMSKLKSYDHIPIEIYSTAVTFFGCQVSQIPPSLKNHIGSILDQDKDFEEYEPYVHYDPFGLNRESNFKNIAKIAALDIPILIEGKPGIGKTKTIEKLAYSCNTNLVRINLCEETEMSDLIGKMQPGVGSDSSELQISWVDGPVLDAIKNKKWILLDEINLAQQSILEGLNSLLDDRKSIYVPELDENFKFNPRITRIFATLNPGVVARGRKELPKSFLNRFIKIVFAPPTTSKLRRKLYESFYISDKDIDTGYPTAYLLNPIADFVTEGLQSGLFADLNYRDVNKFQILFDDKLYDPKFEPRSATLLHMWLNSKLATDQSIHKISDYIDNSTCLSKDLIFPFQSFNGKIYNLHHGIIDCTSIHQTLLSYFNNDPSLNKSLMQMIIAIKTRFPLIINCESPVKIDFLMQFLSKIFNQRIVYIDIHDEFDNTDLIGQFVYLTHQVILSNIYETIRQNFMIYHSAMLVCPELPLTLSFKISAMLCQLFRSIKRALADFSNEIEIKSIIPEFLKLICGQTYLQKLFDELSKCLQRFIDYFKSETSNSFSRFVWKDSPLIEAVKKGYWIFFNDPHLANAGVIDRLSSLLEDERKILLNESGESIEIKAHKKFRAIFYVNNSISLLSRPLKDRCLTLHFDKECEIGSMMSEYKYDYKNSSDNLNIVADKNGSLNMTSLYDILSHHKLPEAYAKAIEYKFKPFASQNSSSNKVCIEQEIDDGYLQYMENMFSLFKPIDFDQYLNSEFLFNTFNHIYPDVARNAVNHFEILFTKTNDTIDAINLIKSYESKISHLDYNAHLNTPINRIKSLYECLYRIQEEASDHNSLHFVLHSFNTSINISGLNLDLLAWYVCNNILANNVPIQHFESYRSSLSELTDVIVSTAGWSMNIGEINAKIFRSIESFLVLKSVEKIERICIEILTKMYEALEILKAHKIALNLIKLANKDLETALIVEDNIDQMNNVPKSAFSIIKHINRCLKKHFDDFPQLSEVMCLELTNINSLLAFIGLLMKKFGLFENIRISSTIIAYDFLFDLKKDIFSDYMEIPDSEAFGLKKFLNIMMNILLIFVEKYIREQKKTALQQCLSELNPMDFCIPNNENINQMIRLISSELESLTTRSFADKINNSMSAALMQCLSSTQLSQEVSNGILSTFYKYIEFVEGDKIKKSEGSMIYLTKSDTEFFEDMQKFDESNTEGSFERLMDLKFSLFNSEVDNKSNNSNIKSNDSEFLVIKSDILDFFNHLRLLILDENVNPSTIFSIFSDFMLKKFIGLHQYDWNYIGIDKKFEIIISVCIKNKRENMENDIFKSIFSVIQSIKTYYDDNIIQLQSDINLYKVFDSMTSILKMDLSQRINIILIELNKLTNHLKNLKHADILHNYPKLNNIHKDIESCTHKINIEILSKRFDIDQLFDLKHNNIGFEFLLSILKLIDKLDTQNPEYGSINQFCQTLFRSFQSMNIKNFVSCYFSLQILIKIMECNTKRPGLAYIICCLHNILNFFADAYQYAKQIYDSVCDSSKKKIKKLHKIYNWTSQNAQSWLVQKFKNEVLRILKANDANLMETYYHMKIPSSVNAIRIELSTYIDRSSKFLETDPSMFISDSVIELGDYLTYLNNNFQGKTVADYNRSMSNIKALLKTFGISSKNLNINDLNETTIFELNNFDMQCESNELLSTYSKGFFSAFSHLMKFTFLHCSHDTPTIDRKYKTAFKQLLTMIVNDLKAKFLSIVTTYNSKKTLVKFLSRSFRKYIEKSISSRRLNDKKFLKTAIDEFLHEGSLLRQQCQTVLESQNNSKANQEASEISSRCYFLDLSDIKDQNLYNAFVGDVECEMHIIDRKLEQSNPNEIADADLLSFVPKLDEVFAKHFSHYDRPIGLKNSGSSPDVFEHFNDLYLRIFEILIERQLNMINIFFYLIKFLMNYIRTIVKENTENQKNTPGNSEQAESSETNANSHGYNDNKEGEAENQNKDIDDIEALEENIENQTKENNRDSDLSDQDMINENRDREENDEDNESLEVSLDFEEDYLKEKEMKDSKNANEQNGEDEKQQESLDNEMKKLDKDECEKMKDQQWEDRDLESDLDNSTDASHGELVNDEQDTANDKNYQNSEDIPKKDASESKNSEIEENNEDFEGNMSGSWENSSSGSHNSANNDDNADDIGDNNQDCDMSIEESESALPESENGNSDSKKDQNIEINEEEEANESDIGSNQFSDPMECEDARDPRDKIESQVDESQIASDQISSSNAKTATHSQAGVKKTNASSTKSSNNARDFTTMPFGRNQNFPNDNDREQNIADKMDLIDECDDLNNEEMKNAHKYSKNEFFDEIIEDFISNDKARQNEKTNELLPNKTEKKTSYTKSKLDESQIEDNTHLEGEIKQQELSESIEGDQDSLKQDISMENDSLCKDIPEKPDLENYKIVNNRIQDLDLRNNYVEFETNGLVDDNIGFNISEENAKSLWIELSNEVINDSYLLGEKIKAYLQPNSMKRYKKGFKSGKKLNIQKLIQYVASNYQKDRIWMKRVRPTKLTYRTLLLMDDSLSMHHTQIKRDLLKSLCMISTAVTASSLGDLSICKFGNKFEIIVPFTQQLSEGDNIEIIRSLNFSQQSSELSSALRQLSDYILEGRNQSFDNLNNCDVNEIVFILTDGRNLGNSEFSSQIGNLINNHIAPLLIFLDLNQKESLENIQVPRFINGNQIIFDNYLSILPVPFYLLIKDIGQLSSAISECLTEWIGSFYG